MNLSRPDAEALHHTLTHTHTHDSAHMGLGFEQVPEELGAPLNTRETTPPGE